MSQNATRNAKGKSAKTNASNTKHTQNTEDSLSTTKNTTLTKDPNRIAEALVRFLNEDFLSLHR